ncbi:MAG: EamA family transporter [Nanohaloarchaea archaeon]|nr:EamA family transporter [Candidatus Nanohaloarchaea archaeon]
MEWLLTALSSAFFFSILNVVTKKLTQDISGLAYNFIFSLSALILLLPFSTYFGLNTNLTSSIVPWLALVGSGIANTFGIIAYNNSIKQGEISEVIPLTKLTPIFTAVLGFSILGEEMTPLMVTGILAVTLGSYIVLLRKNKSLVGPLKRLFTNRAALLASISSVIYAFASIMDRFGTQAIRPEVYVSGIFLVMSACFTVYLGTTKREKLIEAKNAVREKPSSFFLVGLLAAGAYLSIFIAYSMAAASKVIPVLQLQVLASVAAGGYLFNEQNMLRKVVGSVILVVGVVLIAL